MLQFVAVNKHAFLVSASPSCTPPGFAWEVLQYGACYGSVIALQVLVGHVELITHALRTR